MKTKKINYIFGILILFLYLLLYPLGNLVGRSIQVFGRSINIHPIDIVVYLSLPLMFFGKFKKPRFFYYLIDFIYIAIFSILFSLLFVPYKFVLIGSLFIIRLFSYICFSVIVWSIVQKYPEIKNYIEKILFIIIFAISILGWLQYLFFFDIRFLKNTGWDDHFGRITAPFLDPSYTGIILILGLIFIFEYFLQKRNKILFILLIFVITTILFTYSRASILALLIVILIKSIQQIKIKGIIYFLFILLAIFFLPRIASEGTRLERIQSIIQRTSNYKETLIIISKSPVFGVGFNNLCYLRESIFKGDIKSHSCSGSDSSILFVIATTGIAGFLVLIGFIRRMNFILTSSIFSRCLKLGFIAIFIHSFFANSFFYTWIMGWMAIMLALAYKEPKLLGKTKF